MKRRSILAATLAAVVASSALPCFAADKKKVLFFSPSFGFRHSVVRRPLTGELSHAEKHFKEFATKAGFQVSVSQDFNDLSNLDAFKQFDAVVFYTSGNPPFNKDALVKYVSGGGALIGVHAGGDTYKDWPKYVEMIGGAFKGHGCNDKDLVLKIEDQKHPATKMFGSEWVMHDEMYQFNQFSRDNVHVLISVDTEKSDPESLKAHQMEKGKDYPVAWTNTEGKGRIFYTSPGHREDIWTNHKYQQHLIAGIKWAMKVPCCAK
jgi:type 1 glutamine amidotransferase